MQSITVAEWLGHVTWLDNQCMSQ